MNRMDRIGKDRSFHALRTFPPDPVYPVHPCKNPDLRVSGIHGVGDLRVDVAALYRLKPTNSPAGVAKYGLPPAMATPEPAANGLVQMTAPLITSTAARPLEVGT